MRQRKARRRAGAALLVVLSAAASPACAPAPPPRPPKQEAAPSWADVFEGTPDLYAVIRSRRLKSDAVYGSFWRALVRAAEARGFARGATMLEAAEGSEEIIVGLSRGADAALVLRGVPARLDPRAMADDEGRPLFRAADDRASVVEYQLADGASADGALFVLPDRSWVGALGEARARARRVFARPLGRRPLEIDARALVAVRVRGPLAHALERHPLFGPLSAGLASATFTLTRGEGGVIVTLAYASSSAAAAAEVHARRAVEELAKDEERRSWLGETEVAREQRSLLVRLAVPPRLLEELPGATGRDLAF